MIKNRALNNDYTNYQKRVTQSMEAIRPMLLGEMHHLLDFACSWAKEINAPIVNTESWGPWWHMDHIHLDWQWMKDWCEECNALAGDYGLWGTTPWNYCHPYWSTWNDINWYQRVNSNFITYKKI